MPSSLLTSLRARLIEPPASITRADLRRNARLLSMLFLIIPPITFAVVIAGVVKEGRLAPSAWSELFSGAAYFAAYLLSRTRHTRAAALVGIGTLSLLPFSSYVLRGDFTTEATFGSLVWLVIPVVACGLYVGLRAAVANTVLVVGLLLSLPAFVEGLALRTVALPASVVAAFSIFEIMVLYHLGRLEADRLAEIAQTNRTLAVLREENGRLVQEAQGAIAQLTDWAREIVGATGEQSAGAAAQSEAMGRNSEAVSALEQQSQVSASTLQAAAQRLERAEVVSSDSQRAVDDTAEAFARLSADVHGIAHDLGGLAEHARSVGEIIRTVEDFATQSNVLALNASIEAASAGAAGAGFAVVARQVRELAGRSRQAVSQVRGVLGEILKSARAAAQATETGVRTAEERVQLTAHLRKAIESLGESIRTSAADARSVAEAGLAQAARVEQISQAMDSVNQQTSLGLASTAKVAKAAKALDELARALARTVERYRN